MSHSASPDTSTGRTVDSTARKALVAELPPVLRRVYTAVLEHTLASGAPVDPAALVIVLSALDDLSDDPLAFRAEAIRELLWFGIAQFCADLGLVAPPRCAEALFATAALTIADDRFATTGDPLPEVFAAMRELTQVG